MNVYAWVLVVWVLLAILFFASQVEKPRQPLTSTDVVMSILFGVFQIWLIYMTATA